MKHNDLTMGEKYSFESLYQDARNIIERARDNAVRSVDFCRVQMYWNLGKRIFEEEQQRKNRADYGAYLIKNLSEQLLPEFGSGFGVRQLETCRQFYRLYPIAHTLRAQLNWSQNDFARRQQDHPRKRIPTVLAYLRGTYQRN